MFKKLITASFTILFGMTLHASDTPASDEAGEASVNAQMLVYQIEEQGAGTWFSRIYVTDDMIRLDEPGGEGVTSFTLYDRLTREIYNVDLDGRTALQITAPDEAPEINIPVEIEIAEGNAPDASGVLSGESQRRWTLTADGDTCLEITTVEERMPEIRNALNELYATLARQHALTLFNTPQEFVTPCDIALHVRMPDFRYGKGLLVTSHSERQKEQLVDLGRDEKVAASLFEVPDGVILMTPSMLNPLQ